MLCISSQGRILGHTHTDGNFIHAQHSSLALHVEHMTRWQLPLPPEELCNVQESRHLAAEESRRILCGEQEHRRVRQRTVFHNMPIIAQLCNSPILGV